jgi:hypothetical protein
MHPVKILQHMRQPGTREIFRCTDPNCYGVRVISWWREAASRCRLLTWRHMFATFRQLGAAPPPRFPWAREKFFDSRVCSCILTGQSSFMVGRSKIVIGGNGGRAKYVVAGNSDPHIHTQSPGVSESYE